MDSPGGAVSGVNAFADIVAAGAKKKYTTAFVAGAAASAAYWIASAASEIAMERTGMRAAHHRGVDERLIEASLGSNESVEADGGFLIEKDIADGLLRRTFEVSRIIKGARRLQLRGAVTA